MYSNLRHSKLFRTYMYVRLDGSAEGCKRGHVLSYENLRVIYRYCAKHATCLEIIKC